MGHLKLTWIEHIMESCDGVCVCVLCLWCSLGGKTLSVSGVVDDGVVQIMRKLL